VVFVANFLIFSATIPNRKASFIVESSAIIFEVSNYMKTRFVAFAALAAMFLNIAAFATWKTHGDTAGKRQASRLVALLPASDAVAVFDSKRFLGDAMPKVLTANQPLLNEIMSKVAEIETKTGLDIRKFEQAAVGVRYRQVSPTEVDFEPVILASGEINAGALVAAAKLASNGTYREEKIGERTVYVFTPKNVIQKTASTHVNSKIAAHVDKAIKSMTKELAVTTLDRNTLVVGSLARVRETLEGRTHPTADITGLLSQKETAVASFAGRVPAGMAKLLPLDNDELGKNIDAIQYLAGSFDVAAAGASLQVMARMQKVDQAEQLKDTLDVLRLMGKGLFGGSKRDDQKIYGRLLENAKFTQRGTDITLDLLVPQADVDFLIAKVKVK
jgi:hypothetical protein